MIQFLVYCFKSSIEQSDKITFLSKRKKRETWTYRNKTRRLAGNVQKREDHLHSLGRISNHKDAAYCALICHGFVEEMALV